jgi:molecular chaperone DnaJ
MAKRCYYEVLEVERTATDAQLKAAFRKLAMQYHPDRNPEDPSEHKFKEINEAYEVLKDGDKRAAYDRFGHAACEHGGVGAGRPATSIFFSRSRRIRSFNATAPICIAGCRSPW